MRPSTLLLLPRTHANTIDVYRAGGPEIARHLFMASALPFYSLTTSVHSESVCPGLRKLSIRNVWYIRVLAYDVLSFTPRLNIEPAGPRSGCPSLEPGVDD